MSSNYAQLRTEHRRLTILRILAEDPGYTVNSSIIADILPEWGQKVSRDVIHADFAWLAEQGLVETEERGSVHVAQLTQRGADVAGGVAHVPGVKRPGPGG